MAQNNELSSRRKQIREPPSIPFLWESRPGVAIKNWKPEKLIQVHHNSQVATNLVASVPFIWEEKPGKPIPFLLIDEFSECDSNWDCESSMGSYMTGTDASESIRSMVVTRKQAAPTLGELIMMSRKMSIRRRRAEMRHLSMDMKMKKRGLSMSCFNISESWVGIADWKTKIQPLLMKLAN